MKILLLWLLSSLMLFTSCQKDDPQPVTPAPGEPATGLSYLALGDSYTIGHGIEPAGRYPVQLTEALKQRGLPIRETKIIATTGWTTADLKRGIAQADLNRNWDLVSLLIGVNNQYQGISLVEYEREFKELLEQSIALAGGDKSKVFVLSIPDYGYTPFGRSNQERISAEIDRFNAANKEITETMGVSYFNITPISRQGLLDPSLLADDGLHPSEKMYAQWVDLILEEVVKKIQQ